MMKKMMLVSMFLAACGGANVAPAASATTTGAAPAKTVVLVHGAFADGSSWEKVIPLLQAKGLNVVAVQNPLTSLAADVDAANRVIDQQNKPVILVGHSWGGAVITQAGNNPKVASLVYVCAFAPDSGESANDTTKELGAPPWASGVRPDSGGFLSLSPDAIAKFFAQDLSPTAIGVIAATQGAIQAKALDEKVTHAAWHDKPTTYIIGLDDHMIAPPLERTFAKKMNATTIELPSSHVAMISKPNEVAAAILAAAERAQ